MGNAASTKDRHDDTVDYGSLVPFGVYSAPQDWNQAIVTQFIIDRKLAPFYRPLEDYEDAWDDDQILAARKELPPAEPPGSGASDGGSAPSSAHPVSHSAHSSLSKFSKHHAKAQQQQNEAAKLSEAAIYRGATECPICLLYYPPNMNRSRCCDQAICTECFVQIKRAEPTTTHLVSEPAACPYCVRDNFGVIYAPPPWRAGIGADASSAASSRPELSKVNSGSSGDADASATRRGKRKSISHTSPDVVTIDQIRPDWEAKLAAVRAAVTRRANRRIIMRQVGDRLIPVGVTSGRLHAVPGGGSQLGDGTVLVTEAPTPPYGDEGGRRSGRTRNRDLSQLLGGLTIGGQDLEELMVMEAMRLSLLEHEEQQRREREAAARAGSSGQNVDAEAGGSGSGSASSPSPLAVPSPRRSAPPSHQGSPLPPSSLVGTSPSGRSPLSSALGRAALSGALAIGLPSPRPDEQPAQVPPAQHSRQETPTLRVPELPAITTSDAPATTVSHSPAEPVQTPGSTTTTGSEHPYEVLVSNPPTSASDSMPLLDSTTTPVTEDAAPAPAPATATAPRAE
ncbi:hypothetical protein AURDEDRAFT_110838 [Auricularia subglabra TFB-10046 SS5]|nr:hypothetical protein AURDEDRAFT_110838 [Auricularia subglabra TFB-10046 SS5]